ncbi:MAG: O-antigen ligase family protein [Candidatus Liptonbacteria bacterium]|nr:O-antigen ligase family protein [Candidatus Liptonbacteria bacterium]
MLLKLSKFFLHVSLFSVVVVMTSTFFPFIGGKDYFFRFTIELAFIFAVLWWAFESEGDRAWARVKEVSGKPLFIAVSAFVLAVLLATLFAYDPNAAFWSNYERGEGAFQMLHYYAFFALLVVFFEKKEDWRTFFKTFLFAGAFMVFYGILADTGWAGRFISQYQGGERPPGSAWLFPLVNRFQGSLGNPAYVAPYLMFSLFFSAYLWITSKINKRWLAGLVYGAPAFFFLVFFMVTQTRGAFMGILIATYVGLVFVGFMQQKYRWLSLGLIAALAFITGIFVHFRSAAWLQSIPGGRMFDLPLNDGLIIALGIGAIIAAALAEFAREHKFLRWAFVGLVIASCIVGFYALRSGRVNLVDPTTSTRFWTWGSAWQGFKERPILGWGPENFTTVFDKYFDARHFNPGQQASETWFDRAHSIYFDYLSETGILGLLSFLGIFAVLYWGLLRGGTAEGGSVSVLERMLMIAIPIGYLVQGVAIFDVLPIYINLFAFFAFGHFFLYSLSGKVERRNK